MAERPLDDHITERPLRHDAPRQNSWAMGLVAILGVLLLVGIIWAVAVNDDESEREPTTARIETQRTNVDIDAETERSQDFDVFVQDTQSTLDRLELQQQSAEQQARIQALRARVGQLESADAEQAATVRSEIEASVQEIEREVQSRESADTTEPAVVTANPPAATQAPAEAELALQQSRERIADIGRQLSQLRQQASGEFAAELNAMETRIGDFETRLDEVPEGPERQQLEADLVQLESDLRQLADRVADVAGR